MKNFVKHIFAIAICAAALLSSCIKEQPFELKIAQLEVAVTRADASSSKKQGDGIGNAMIWVFKCAGLDENGAPDGDIAQTAVAWRSESNINVSSTVNLHVQLPLCDTTTDHQDYILVAVLNTEAFGSTITLDKNTTFSELQHALFDASNAEFWKRYPSDGDTDTAPDPWKMPVSNWKTFTVTNDNIHPSFCYKLNLPVYRAVAKSQLFVKPASDNFTVTVNSASICSSAMPTNGAILTSNVKSGLTNNTIKSGVVYSQEGNAGDDVLVPAVVPNITYTAGAAAKPLHNGYGENSALAFSPITASATDYTWVGSTFIYENEEALQNDTEEYATVPTGNAGYYMQISYTVSGDDYIKYVKLPAVVRNHDYQIKATVDAGGELTLTIAVNEWNVDQWQNMDYQNTVVVEEGNHIKWWDILNANTDIFKPEDEAADVTNNENIIDDATKQVNSGKLYFKGDAEPGHVATCSFTLKAPVGGEWYAELVTITGDPDHFVFEKAEVGSRSSEGVFIKEKEIAGGGTIISGDIESREVMLYLSTVATNSMKEDNATEPCVVELQITAKKDWGGRTRTYKVYGLIDIDGATFTNYELTHLLAI